MIAPLSIGVQACKKGNVELGSVAVIFGAGSIGLTTLLAAQAYGASKTLAIGKKTMFPNRSSVRTFDGFIQYVYVAIILRNQTFCIKSRWNSQVQIHRKFVNGMSIIACVWYTVSTGTTLQGF